MQGALCCSLPVGEKFFPVGIFFVEYRLLFGGKLMGIVPKQIKDALFVKAEKVFADYSRRGFPPYCIARFLFVEEVGHCHHALSVIRCLCHDFTIGREAGQSYLIFLMFFKRDT